MRSSGSAWIEPKRGTPCRVCWRRNRKKQKPSRWFVLRADARKLRDALNVKLRAERPIIAAGQVLPIIEVRDRWLLARQREGKMAETTAYRCSVCLASIITAMKWRTVDDVTPASLSEWRQTYTRAGNGLPMRNLAAMLRWCSQPETLAQTLHHGLNLKVAPTRMAERDQASPAQMALMLKRARALGQFPLVHCIMSYPWRPKSFLLLESTDVNLKDPLRATMLLKRTKNGKDVRGQLLPETSVILAEHLGDRCGRVFLSPTGEPWPMDQGGSSSVFSKWFRKNITHDMPHVAYDGKRGSMTDLMAAADNDIPTVAAMAGVSKQTVLRYLQTNDDKKRAAMARYAAIRQGAMQGLDIGNQ